MSIIIENEREIMQEAAAILLEHMPVSKVARLLSIWQVGRGDYTVERRNLFSGETVDHLLERARTLAKRKRKR